MPNPKTPVPHPVAGPGKSSVAPTSQGAAGVAESTGKTYRLDLPYPRPPLNHNDRLGHWRRSEIVRQIRGDVSRIAKGRIPAADRIVVQLHYAPGRRGRRDPMNLTATSKPAIDGLVDAGVVVDDDSAHVHELTPEIHFPPEPGPRCWLHVTVYRGEAA